MTHPTKAVRSAALALAFGTTLAALGACTDRGRSDDVRDGDTGAAAPATRPILDAPSGPDSTAGISARTGKRGVAGDTMGSKGVPAGTSAPKP